MSFRTILSLFVVVKPFCFQKLNAVTCIAIWILRETIFSIWNYDPQHSASSFFKLVKTYITVIVDSGYQVAGMESFAVLDSQTKCVQDPANFLCWQIKNQLKVWVSIAFHPMCVRIARMREEAGLNFAAFCADSSIGTKMDDPVNVLFHVFSPFNVV